MALLVLDVQYMTTGEGPLALAVPHSNCRMDLWKAIGDFSALVGAFRSEGVSLLCPYIHVTECPRGKHGRMPVEIMAEDRISTRQEPYVQKSTPFLTDNTTSGCIPTAGNGVPREAIIMLKSASSTASTAQCPGLQSISWSHAGREKLSPPGQVMVVDSLCVECIKALSRIS